MPSSLACATVGVEHLSLALGIDDRDGVCVLPRRHIAHEQQAILHQLEHGAHVRIGIGEHRSRTGGGRQEAQKKDREYAGHGGQRTREGIYAESSERPG